MNSDYNNIPVEIKPYLNEISKRIWSNHAALMIGSGFSKNAEIVEKAKKSAPNWSELGNIFYEKIYGRLPDNNEHYLNVLKLADEVQAAFGRPVLDQIIRSQIPDKEYKPSKLHIKLLKLPWTDIFTTNYDTLLERACDSVVSPKYDVVICKEDLIYSEKPRIIKLHGSFPSERPFIISAEDYRRYPKEFAPFVNTVQQSLLENTLCLIGFSGDDPNFLQWIGWIHDNLGLENSPKIYLIGVFDLSDSQRKLLEQKNIVLIDLSKIEKNHYKALDFFIEFLLKQKLKMDKLDWPNEKNISFKETDTKNYIEIINKVCNIWNQTRLDYPNWMILPQDCREILWLYTEFNLDYINHLDGIKEPYDLFFIYELNWRFEKCLYPIPNESISIYERIINKYNPFPEKLILRNTINPHENKEFEWESIKQKWIELNLSILRYYRESGNIFKWNELNVKLNSILDYFPPDLIAKFYYECCQNELFLLNISELTVKIKTWPINETLPFWEAKRASLLAELGNVNDAILILEKSLSYIRQQLNLSPVSNDFHWVSQESYVMILYRFFNDVKRFEQSNIEIKKEIVDFKERWNTLKQYKCDPWNELTIFDSLLQQDLYPIIKKLEQKGFDLGTTFRTFNLSISDKEVLKAYAYLRFQEETSLPYKIFNHTFRTKTAIGAIKRIYKYSPFWAFSTIVRIGETKLLDDIYDRTYLSKIDISEVDLLIKNYIDIIKKSLLELKSNDISSIAINIASILPELLSRLCLKCSDSSKLLIIDLLKRLYMSDKKNIYRGISNLLKRLLQSLSDEELHKYIPSFLEYPILTENDFIESEYIDPFYFMNFNKKHDYKNIIISIDKNHIKNLINNSTSLIISLRKKAINRLKVLYEHEQLSESEVEDFTKNLWSQVDEKNNLPNNIDNRKFELLFLPYPSTINLKVLFKNYLLSESLIKKHENGIPLDNHMPALCFDILYGTKIENNDQFRVDWDDIELIEILKKLTNWWDTEKSYLNKNDSGEFWSVADTYYFRLKKIVEILARIIIPKVQNINNNDFQNTLTRLFAEFEYYRIPSLWAQMAYSEKFEQNQPDLLSEIEFAISSDNNDKICDALYAVESLLFFSTNISTKTSNLLFLICNKIRWRKKRGSIFLDEYNKLH